MKPGSENKEKDQKELRENENNADCTRLDADADKSGTDTGSDSTEKRKGPVKFDKPKREVDPDRTGIDIDSDKTKNQENSK